VSYRIDVLPIVDLSHVTFMISFAILGQHTSDFFLEGKSTCVLLSIQVTLVKVLQYSIILKG
jgi:hypothetical protein